MTLNHGRARHAFAFDPAQCMAPLPRAYQWADGSAYLNHVELVRKARGAEVPESFYTDPLMYQGGSDDFLGPCDRRGRVARRRLRHRLRGRGGGRSPATCRWAHARSRRSKASAC